MSKTFGVIEKYDNDNDNDNHDDCGKYEFSQIVNDVKKQLYVKDKYGNLLYILDLDDFIKQLEALNKDWNKFE